ncbi:MAG TPA: glycerol kinase GlpK [Gemmatimonadaceae bacterium]|jgi:glycerol kinase|nr:glycerol kinase GlpK [Gemmatimonadaceae bacterium]
MRHILAIDEGTTGVTCLIIGEDGRVAGRGYREIKQHFPRPGWVEHDPLEILECVRVAAGQAIATADGLPVAIGITNQRETVVIWELATGRPVHRAIVWQDRRTAERCRELSARTDWITERTGLVPDPYFSASKIEWLLREQRLLERYTPADLAVGTIDSWLIWQLTGGGVHATDATNASRTMLFDINKQQWSDELCDVFGVPMAMLPEVRLSSGDFGVARGELLGADAPILGVAGDQQAALFGQGCWTRGTGKNTYGTGAFLLLNAGMKRPTAGSGLLTTIACDASGGPAYALEAAIFIAGAAVQWLRDGLGIIETAADTETLARSIESTDGVYFVPALTGLGAPHWESRARGTIVGLTRGTGRAHIARAALEAMAYGTAEVLANMRDESGASFERLRVDGGATNNDWLMQFQADILGVPVERPDMVETTALGAAGLAGLAAGVWRDADEFLATRRFTRFTPRMDRSDAKRLMAGWQRAVGAAVAWARDDGQAE